MREKIQALAAQRRRTDAKRDALIVRAQSFHAELKEAVGGNYFYGKSDTVTLGDVGSGYYAYGYLSATDWGLFICTRTTYDDAQEEHLPDEHRSGMKMTAIEGATDSDLFQLLTEDTFSTLLQSIGRGLDTRESLFDRSHAALDHILAGESAEIET